MYSFALLCLLLSGEDFTSLPGTCFVLAVVHPPVVYTWLWGRSQPADIIETVTKFVGDSVGP